MLIFSLVPGVKAETEWEKIRNSFQESMNTSGGASESVETEFGHIRLVSCRTGVKDLSGLTAGVEVMLKSGWILRHIDLAPMAENAQADVLPLFQENKTVQQNWTSDYQQSTIFPIWLHDMQNRDVALTVLGKFEACSMDSYKCLHVAQFLNLALPAGEAYPTLSCGAIQYTLKNDLDETTNISDCVMDYTDIEKKHKIEELTPEKILQIIANKKEKLDSYLKEIQKYVMLYITFDKEEEKDLKDKEDKLNNEKKDVKKKIESLVNEQEEIKKNLAEIKEKRTKKFLEFFNKLKDTLKDLYNKLTIKDNNPGGNAYLYCSNEEEPFNGQVIYLPTPPGKRVIYDIEQLSGGEKTIAIVSLLSSLQNITGCPLLILDEVDAYLDQKHELMLEKLFNEAKNNYQIVIVTHKLNIYRSAESLLGTYFNKNMDTSVPISYNNK